MSKRFNFDNLPELITTSQVMEALNISKRQVYLLAKSGAVRATNIARADAERPRYRFYKDSVAKIRNRRLVFSPKEIRAFKKY